MYRVLDKEAPQAAVDNVLNLLLQADYLEDGAFVAANGDAEAAIYKPPPESAKVDGADPPRFDTASDPYKEWISNLSTGALLQNTVIDPYGSEWGNTR